MARSGDAAVALSRRGALRGAPLLAALVAACGGGGGPENPQAARLQAALVTGTPVTGTPEVAQYEYDGAGNLLQVRAQAGAALALAGFAPARGASGQLVVVAGSGFSPIAAQNTVRLNGAAASVSWATPTELAFAVPVGATSGKIAVTVGGTSASSAADFTVIAGVEVADFQPRLGRAGTILAITGAGFSSTPAANAVAVGNGAAAPTTASPTTLLATVGASATSGKVKVTADGSTGTSTDDFYVLPPGVSELDVVFMARATPGTPVHLSIGTPRKTGLVLFDASQDQAVTLAVSGNTLPSSSELTVLSPSGATVLSTTLPSGVDYKLEPGWLPATGTYTIRVQPALGGTGSLDLTVFQDAAVPVTMDGPAPPMSLAAGQNGLYSFAGTTGDQFAFAATALSTTPASKEVTFTFYKPDRTPLYPYAWAYPSAASFPYALPATGTYLVRVSPAGLTSASIAVMLSRPLAGTLATDGTATRFSSARPGQAGSYAFAGTAGQGWTLRATSGSTFAGQVDVYQPSGATIATASLGASADVKLDLGLLPATGAYTVRVTPSGMATGTVDLRLVREAVGTFTIGAAAKTQALSAAQNGRYTFSATAGDTISFAASPLTTSPAAGTPVTFVFHNPDGSYLYNATFYGANAIQLPYTLPTTGTYTLRITPVGTVSASATVYLSKPLTGTLSTSGTVKRFQSARPGQTGSYTFSGTVGQGWTLRATASSTFTGTVYVYQPGGATVANASLGPSRDWKLDLGLLPATGTYKVVVSPYGIATGYLDLKLVREATSTLTIGAAAKSLTLTAAQNGRYAFTGASGDLLSLVVTALTTTPAGKAVTFQVLGADGQNHAWNSTTTAPVTWQLAALPAAGTYTLRVMPDNTAAASFAVQLPRRSP